ncbi:transporter substrate-binding domain-containing protein [Rhizobium sp. SYY.PMSO]|uniref:transporter substrate-binding domain-containing protein n=1 Tax=Rhizobium sp. SYY.PMSO TaxID=3382192 RepID=UPI0039901B45
MKQLRLTIGALIVGSACMIGDGSLAFAADSGMKPTQQDVIDGAPVAKDLPDSPTIDRIRKDGFLIFGGDSSTPLFSQLNPATGKLEGFEAGLAYMFAKYVLGTPDIKVVAVNSANREALLQNGTVEFVASGYAITEQRAKTVNFAGPYLMTGDGILVAKSNTTIHSVDDLNGKTVATNPGVGENNILAAAPKAKVIAFDTGTELIHAVIQGRVDAMVLNVPTLLSAASKYKKQVKVVGDKPFTTLAMGFGLPKSDPALKSIVNDWLATIEKSGDYAKLWQATVGDLAPVPEAPKIGSVPGS